ncbi:MAG: hypothetical protein AAB821_01935, partial [Patescibacteria group bacterium]
ASTTPGTWTSITGSNLSRTQIFVDDKKVPLTNLLFSDALGKEVKYRVQDDLSAGSHGLYAFDANSKLKSQTIFFSVFRSPNVLIPLVVPVISIKDVEVTGLENNNVWRTGVTKNITWTASGGGEIDILVCNRALVSCIQLVSKSKNDGTEAIKLLSTTQVGKGYVIVRKYRDDSVKALSADFTVSAPSAFMQGKMQLASAWQAFQNFLVRIAMGK